MELHNLGAYKSSAFVHQNHVVTKQKVSAPFLLYPGITCVRGAEFISSVIDKTKHLPSSLHYQVRQLTTQDEENTTQHSEE